MMAATIVTDCVEQKRMRSTLYSGQNRAVKGIEEGRPGRQRQELRSRIGQKRNVMVHRFVRRGTVEEKIDAVISEKAGLSRDPLDEGGERLLTEMDNEHLLPFVSLEFGKAMGG